MGSVGDVWNTVCTLAARNPSAKGQCLPRFIWAPPSHLSCFDVLQSCQMQEEVVFREGCLSIGDAAVVAYGENRMHL